MGKVLKAIVYVLFVLLISGTALSTLAYELVKALKGGLCSY
jgi:hypothetical protein